MPGSSALRMSRAAARDERRAAQWRRRHWFLFHQPDMTQALSESLVSVISKKLQGRNADQEELDRSWNEQTQDLCRR